LSFGSRRYGWQHRSPPPKENCVTDHFAGDDRTNRERMLAGDWYISDDPDNWEQAKRAVRLQTKYTAAYAIDPDAARPILAELLGHLGEQAHVKPPLYVDYGTYLSVGARTFINYNLTALDVAPIVIGADCQIGPNVQLLTPVHPMEPQPRKDRLEAARPITIGDNVWLGGGAIICPGVTIGDNSVIGAGAVVTRDIPADSFAVGSPARVIRKL
jgi:maltose O-acetyltransferase